MSADLLAERYLSDVILEFNKMKQLAEKAITQVEDRELFEILDPESNSIAIVMKHMSGNMRSRWTDFLTSDGEKPDRNRDDEFIISVGTTRQSILEAWEDGWNRVFAAIRSLKPQDLLEKVYIRGEAHAVIEAINRQLIHYAYHVGQIVFLAKHMRSSKWKSLSIPRGQSETFNQ